jgi:hypothetical protein
MDNKILNELKELNKNYFILRRELTNQNLNSLEIISELENIFKIFKIEPEKWELPKEVSEIILDGLESIKITVKNLCRIRDLYLSKEDIEKLTKIEYLKYNNGSFEEGSEKFSSQMNVEKIFNELEDINLKILKIRTEIFSSSYIYDILFILWSLMCSNQYYTHRDLPGEINRMFYEGLSSVAHNVSFIMKVYLKNFKETK